jgi:endonuclease I
MHGVGSRSQQGRKKHSDSHQVTLVEKKDKVFVPNNDSRGFISRAILYMYKEYNCNPHKIIDIEILKKWYYNFSPTIEERYHNDIIKRLQNKNNIFISNYNKKNKGIKKILDSL